MKIPPIMFLLVLLAGCGSSPPVRYYTLAAVPPTQHASNSPHGWVQIGTVHIPSALDRRQMVHQGAPNTLSISDQNRWGAPLADMVRDVLTQDLLQRLPQGTVALPDSAAPPRTSVIAIDILEFARDASGTVILDGSWSLSSCTPEAAVAVHHVLLKQPALQPGHEGPDYEGQAAAMSQLLGRLADDISTALAVPRKPCVP